MKSLSHSQILEATAKGLNRWCLYLVFDSGEEDVNILRAAPCLKSLTPFDRKDFIFHNGGTLTFPSERTARKAYESTVGEDGPTATNPYKGQTKVYACLCGPDGKIRTENS